MGQILHKSAGHELTKTLELERLRLEASVNSKIALVLKMADSPLIKRYFMTPNDTELEKLAFEEIKAYGRALGNMSVFWVNDKDKIFYITDHDPYVVNPDDPESYWYNMTLYETEVYNFNINYNPSLDVTNLWVNAPVFDNQNRPIGMVGTGVNISDFINEIYSNYSGTAQLYLFNTSGEITGARNINLVKNKINIEQELDPIGKEILAYLDVLKDDEVKYFEFKKANGIAILGAIPALNWYIAMVYNFVVGDALRTGMTILFAVMMLVIFTVFAAFNIFITKLLEPLYRVVREITQISSDWEIDQKNDAEKKDEIGTLGEFLNMTIIDQLTGIYNRRYFDGNMKKIIRSMSRSGSKLSVLMLDIDFFKKYNDTYGHERGDSCLKSVANILLNSIAREEDFLARYGGEEFVVVLPNTNEDGAKKVAEKLLKNIYDCNIPHEKSDVAPVVTVSIGGTTSVVNHLQCESDYVKCADAALYMSKQNGRNQYSFKAFEKTNS
jgi:methyl-accepting chemotaxis protein